MLSRAVPCRALPCSGCRRERKRAFENFILDGARQLLDDTSSTPVRGQTSRLMLQTDVNYGIPCRGHNLSGAPRRDGILVQAQAVGDFGSEDTTPARAAARTAVARLAGLFVPAR